MASRDMTLKKLAQSTGMNRATVSKALEGNAVNTVSALKIVNALGIAARDLHEIREERRMPI